MPVVSVFSGSYCRQSDVVAELVARTGYRLIVDDQVITRASHSSGMAEAKIAGAFSARTSVFNAFTHEKERSIAHIRLAVAESLADDSLVIEGFVGHLIPHRVSHVLRVCLIADMKSRIARAVSKGLTEKDALKRIHRDDEDRAAWVKNLRDVEDPWDPSLYDIVIPVDSTDAVTAAGLISENTTKAAIKVTPASRRTAEDFVIAARTGEALAREGHHVDVDCTDAAVILTINKNVLMLRRLEEELKEIAEKVEGVTSVITKVGKDFYQTDIYRRVDLSTPSRVLLVDDEREFVQTLSERLQMRDVGSAVAYDGESALDMVREDEPDVMILDLKMPGIDGIEVLRQVKQSHPHIEVIILTGHGSEEDRAQCLKLGAFAYLQKPVDIDALSDTLKKANEKAMQSARLRDGAPDRKERKRE